MLGGGIFTTQTKVLPGAYINFVSTSNASSVLSGRGVATMPLVLDWGPEGEMFEISQEDFVDDARPLLGYRATDDALKGLNDLFKKCKTLYAYRVNKGGAVAACDRASAKYAGTRGNKLGLAITKNTDGTFDVTTYLDGSKVDEQTVSAVTDLEDNDYVIFDKTVALSAISVTNLTGGTDGTADGDTYQAYLDAAEDYTFNVMGLPTDDANTKKVFAAYVERMRDSEGKKFQLVMYNYAADYEGVINVKNTTSEDAAGLVYWVTGAQASCGVGESLLNALYNGTYTVKLENTQTALKNSIKSGYFAFHNVNGKVRVLYDINSLVTTSADKGDVFKDNKTIRVIDEIANDIALIFTENYMGVVPNDADGRLAFWNDIVDNHKALAKERAIQNFESSDVVVSQGEGKNDVLVTDAIEVTGTMAKLYMIVTVS